MITSYRFLNFFNIATSATCIFFIGICFVICNIVTENYHYIYTRRMTFFALLTIGVGFGILQLTNNLPAPVGKEMFAKAYNISMKDEFTHVFFYNCIAALLGLNMASFMLGVFKNQKLNIILRILLADIIGEFIFTFSVIFLIMLPIGESIYTILSMTIISFISKLIFSLICSTIIVPISYKIIPIIDNGVYQPEFLEKSNKI
ncbi:VUT family protein [Francisella sp. SYW-9]|uniref:VUT family protein n=1 Tax=Francisella sp. SYW-9 TaxID=2610888 RepID=UPI00168CF29C|nr:VUT family protein [Francisella sp. SYW-9]